MLFLNNIFVENKVDLPDVENLQEIGSWEQALHIVLVDCDLAWTENKNIPESQYRTVP